MWYNYYIYIIINVTRTQPVLLKYFLDSIYEKQRRYLFCFFSREWLLFFLRGRLRAHVTFTHAHITFVKLSELILLFSKYLNTWKKHTQCFLSLLFRKQEMHSQSRAYISNLTKQRFIPCVFASSIKLVVGCHA